MTPDPERNKWRNEHWVGHIYCGEFNPTNRMGGYDGWRSFSWDSDQERSKGFRLVEGADFRCGF